MFKVSGQDFLYELTYYVPTANNEAATDAETERTEKVEHENNIESAPEQTQEVVQAENGTQVS